MSDGRNLGVGVLLGMLLTGGLMFALYQQSGLAETERKAAVKTVDVPLDASAVFAPLKPGDNPSGVSTQVSGKGVEASKALNTVAGVVKTDLAVAQDTASAAKEFPVASRQINSMALAEEVRATEIIANTVNTSVSAAEMGVLGGKSVPSAELVNALPDGLDLSPTELRGLSAAERAQYDAMLQSYRGVRAKVLALDEERAGLKQRMDSMFEQNEVIETEVKRMRAVLQQLP